MIKGDILSVKTQGFFGHKTWKAYSAICVSESQFTFYEASFTIFASNKDAALKKAKKIEATIVRVEPVNCIISVQYNTSWGK